MKNIFILTCFLLSLSVQAQEKLTGPFTLKVDVSKLREKPGKLFYAWYDRGSRETIEDSIEVSASADEVKFKASLDEPRLVSLRYVTNLPKEQRKIGSAGNMFAVYLEPGEVKISTSDSLNKSVVKGSTSHIQYERLVNMKKPFDERMKPLVDEYSKLYGKKDSLGLVANGEQRKALSKEIEDNVYVPLFREYATTSPVSMRIVQLLNTGDEAEFSKMENLISQLAPRYRQLPSIKVIESEMAIAKITAIGQYAPDFVQNDTLGNPVKLSSLRGKYVLIDFWASWCGPCRRENPNLVKSFNHYRDKNFTVLGVSLDRPGKKDSWMKAIHDDKLTWTQVSDLKYWANAVAKQYAINGIPANFLLDPQGKIIAKNLRGDDLDKKLEEVLGGKLGKN